MGISLHNFIRSPDQSSSTNYRRGKKKLQFANRKTMAFTIAQKVAKPNPTKHLSIFSAWKGQEK